ncbi:AT-rich interactive domain-containing protein 2-like [Macadamia integrifolia]|uniref:AT-rich interactive domain-containing protein 2-like n=1 Tax=Macadamia integrifolia TaxID=60698 RepID=UPI001C4EF689|nr:AT-rich interactive domain-containing protein 2-like [Macadamia integrifolia]
MAKESHLQVLGLNSKSMAGWSILADGSVVECLEILHYLQSNGFCLGLDASLKGSLSGCKDKLRCLFDHILTVFLKDICIGHELRCLPSMLGDGQCVDLFKLFWVVRHKGGYDCVCKDEKWSSVAEESGFDSGVASSLKLIYVKYLYTLDRWLQRIFKDKGVRRGLSDSSGDLGVLPAELRTEFKGMLSELSDQMNIDGRHIQLDSGKNEFLLPAMDSGKNEFLLPLDVPNVMQADGGKNYVDDDEAVEMLDCGADICSRKRKREWFFSGMLNWVIEAAKDPCDLTIGIIPEWSKWKSHEGNEFWVQALLAREALLMKKQICSTSEQSIFQKKQKMHPSMYEDPVDGNHQSTERLRCSQRILSLKNSFSPAPSLSSSSSRSNPKTSLTPSIAALENYQNRKHVPVDSSTPIVGGVSGDDHLQQHVSVGPLFQARVPDWTGVPSESDCKWLGTQVWPLETGQYYTLIESDPIGKGRQYWCDCRLPGSVECVRFHIAEKRMRLKIELGSAFHIWKFNDMGEEVSLPWTEEEEKKFKAIVRLNPPSLGRTFWDQIYKCFPNKKRRDLVSYYFNAFLLRRRSYQNRVTPNSIDSDDDESEFGSVSNGFGHEAVKVADSNSVLCVQNEQCIDLEEHA